VQDLGQKNTAEKTGLGGGIHLKCDANCIPRTQQALVVSLLGDSPRLKGSERGSPPGQGGAPKAETTKNAHPAFAGVLILETLSGWGARYPEKKARRSGRGFCVGFEWTKGQKVPVKTEEQRGIPVQSNSLRGCG
jgi:hypothetical protein